MAAAAAATAAGPALNCTWVVAQNSELALTESAALCRVATHAHMCTSTLQEEQEQLAEVQAEGCSMPSLPMPLTS
jgi:hypothetical protein